MFQNLEAVQEGRTVEIDMVRKEDLSDREILVNGDNVVYQGHIGHAPRRLTGTAGRPLTWLMPLCRTSLKPWRTDLVPQQPLIHPHHRSGSFHDDYFHASRRSMTAAALLVVGATAISGCSSQDEETDTETADTAASETSNDDAAGDGLSRPQGQHRIPADLETAYGETVLEERPERIATISPSARDVELLAALGAAPVIAPQPVERAIWTLDALPGEIEDIYEADASGETPHERVAAAQPDLIVVFGKDISDEWTELSSIAPVVAVEDEGSAASADWHTELELIGEALDLGDAAQQVVADHEEFLEQTRAENPEFDGLTATYLVQYGARARYRLYLHAGLPTSKSCSSTSGSPPNPRAEQFADDTSVSAELVTEVDADLLFIANNTGDEEELEELLTGNELSSSWMWCSPGSGLSPMAHPRGMPTRAGLHEGNLAWAFAASGPLGKEWAAEQLVPIFQDVLQ